MATEEALMRERPAHDIVSSASSCISDAVDDSSSGLNEAEVDSKRLDDDHQLLCLLDAMDHLLCCREDLAKSLSKGWMDIASARYSMGPSRIDQALFSLQPCSASALVSISRSKDFVELESDVVEDEEESDIDGAAYFSLRSSSKINQDNQIASREENATYSSLRQRHFSGSNERDNVEDNSEGCVDDVHAKRRDMAEDQCPKSQQRPDILAWFGTLVSPHLRTAQTSFTEALGVIVELASAQSKILAAYEELNQRGSI